MLVEEWLRICTAGVFAGHATVLGAHGIEEQAPGMSIKAAATPFASSGFISEEFCWFNDRFRFGRSVHAQEYTVLRATFGLASNE